MAHGAHYAAVVKEHFATDNRRVLVIVRIGQQVCRIAEPAADEPEHVAHAILLAHVFLCLLSKKRLAPFFQVVPLVSQFPHFNALLEFLVH